MKLSRYVKLDEWFFEVKTVRAIKTEQYGDKYSAIANFNLNGNQAYIDGLMTRENDAFCYQDYLTFREFCRQINIESANFDRFKGSNFVSQQVIVTPEKPSSILQLVK